MGRTARILLSTALILGTFTAPLPAFARPVRTFDRSRKLAFPAKVVVGVAGAVAAAHAYDAVTLGSGVSGWGASAVAATKGFVAAKGTALLAAAGIAHIAVPLAVPAAIGLGIWAGVHILRKKLPRNPASADNLGHPLMRLEAGAAIGGLGYLGYLGASHAGLFSGAGASHALAALAVVPHVAIAAAVVGGIAVLAPLAIRAWQSRQARRSASAGTPAAGPAGAAASVPDANEAVALETAARLTPTILAAYHTRAVKDLATLRSHPDVAAIADPDLQNRVVAHLSTALEAEHRRTMDAATRIADARRAADERTKAEWRQKADAIGAELAAQGMPVPRNIAELEALRTEPDVAGTDAARHLNELAGLAADPAHRALRGEVLAAVLARQGERHAEITADWTNKAQKLGAELAKAKVHVPGDLRTLEGFGTDPAMAPLLSSQAKRLLGELSGLPDHSPALALVIGEATRGYTAQLRRMLAHPRLTKLADAFRRR